MSEADNVRHWPADERGVYEVWYTTWNHPTTGEGFWLRFILEAPAPGSGGVAGFGEAPRGELWFARFDPRDPKRTFGIHKRFPIERVAVQDQPFQLHIGDATLRHTHSSGELQGGEHTVRWDLRWDAGDHTLRFLPDVMYLRGGLGETTVHSPNPRVALSGRVMIDGEELAFDRAIAGQTHLWGKKHAYSWIWGRCADFGGEDALLEILGVRLKRRGVTLPKMMLVNLELEGERHYLNQFRHVSVNRGTWDVGLVTFTARSPSVKIEGELRCTPEQMVNAPYIDPDGQELYCANTEIGDARVVVYKRAGLGWREHRLLESHGRAHFEIGSRTRDPLVVRPHQLVS
jgi:hypothetical protein